MLSCVFLNYCFTLLKTYWKNCFSGWSSYVLSWFYHLKNLLFIDVYVWNNFVFFQYLHWLFSGLRRWLRHPFYHSFNLSQPHFSITMLPISSCFWHILTLCKYRICYLVLLGNSILTIIHFLEFTCLIHHLLLFRLIIQNPLLFFFHFCIHLIQYIQMLIRKLPVGPIFIGIAFPLKSQNFNFFLLIFAIILY